MYGVRVMPRAFLGVETEPSVETASVGVLAVAPESPAWRGGVRAGDRILAIDGRAPSGWSPIDELVHQVPPGRPLHLLVARSGAPAPLPLEVVPEPRPPREVTLSRHVV